MWTKETNPYLQISISKGNSSRWGKYTQDDPILFRCFRIQMGEMRERERWGRHHIRSLAAYQKVCGETSKEIYRKIFVYKKTTTSVYTRILVFEVLRSRL